MIIPPARRILFRHATAAVLPQFTQTLEAGCPLFTEEFSDEELNGS
jgi:hypothetical protein